MICNKTYKYRLQWRKYSRPLILPTNLENAQSVKQKSALNENYGIKSHVQGHVLDEVIKFNLKLMD